MRWRVRTRVYDPRWKRSGYTFGADVLRANRAARETRAAIERTLAVVPTRVARTRAFESG